MQPNKVIAVQNQNSNLPEAPKTSSLALWQGLCGLEGVKASPHSPKDCPSSVVVDSRKLESGCVFIAISGGSVDGHDFIDQAVAAGASFIIAEKIPADLSIPYLQVHSSRSAWSAACALLWNKPHQKLRLIGVTGTNGKTSAVWMIRSIFSSVGRSCATIGTLGFYSDKRHLLLTHTTPDPDVLFALLHLAVQDGAEFVAMEVSSHALAQEKITGLKFEAGVFTSFSQDHLDFHKTMEEYLRVKKRLFLEFMKTEHTSIIHESIPVTRSEISPTGQNVISYGSSPGVDLQVACCHSQIKGFSDVTVTGGGFHDTFNIPFIGDVFAFNFAAALAVAQSLSVIVQRDFSAANLKIPPVPGRMRPVLSMRVGRPLVLVDYAHTPDALEKSLATARTVTERSLIVVFGCGGDRDKSKRPAMGKIAQRLADRVVVTNDNPRFEDAVAIASDIMSEMPTKGNVDCILDRALAIQTAIRLGGPGDTVLIAGKGHEDYQIFEGKKVFFSDEHAAQQCLDSQKSWCVAGTGLSGAAAATSLASQGDRVVVSDSSAISPAIKSTFVQSNIVFFESGHSPEHLDTVTSLVLSPGISKTNLLYAEAVQRKMNVCSELDLGLEGFTGTLVAVTGTNGKSTICALTEFTLNRLGVKALACGNIGLPPSALSPELKTKATTLVLEASSYQLEQSLKVRCHVAIFSSFSFDHIARHGSLEEYFHVKWKIMSNIAPAGIAIIRGHVYTKAIELGAHLPKCRTIIIHDTRPVGVTPSPEAEHWWIESESVVTDKGQVYKSSGFGGRGLANLINFAFVVAASKHVTAMPEQSICHAASDFPGLPHRCEVVGKTKRGLSIINDSKSTNVEASLIALASQTSPVVLLLGGAGKGERFHDILKFKDKISEIVAFGASRRLIFEDLKGVVPVHEVERLQDAVKLALKIAERIPSPLLFSPACASFDEFMNFEERGQKFMNWVKEETAR